MAIAPRPAPLASECEDVDLAALVRRARMGSAAAFEQLVRLYGQRLHRFLVLRLGGERDARDALQETLVAAWQGLPGLERPERIWPWLAAIAAHKAADAARRRPPLVDAEPEPAAEVDDVELLAFRDALAELPERFREVLLLRYLLRLSEEETAAALGVRVGTVKSRSSRAKRALEELLG